MNDFGIDEMLDEVGFNDVYKYTNVGTFYKEDENEIREYFAGMLKIDVGSKLHYFYTNGSRFFISKGPAYDNVILLNI